MKLSGFLPAMAILAVSAASASAQVSCSVNLIPNLTRVEGFTEMLADVILICTGGTPTPAGSLVPQMNFTLFLNTNVSSRILAPSASAAGANFSEALMLVDEPNEPVGVTGAGISHPLLNCGQAGAPDKGPGGPGVCDIQATGVPAQTYDGTPNAGAGCFSGTINIAVIPTNNYGCGRPNAYQGVYSTSYGSNQIRFNGVPFDPPGPTGQHSFRITNIRADLPAFGTGTPQVIGTLSVTGTAAVTVTGNTNMLLSDGLKGMTVSSPAPGTIRVTEGFAEAFKARNIAELPANGVYSAGKWLYTVPDKNAPVDAAQNVPSAVLNYNTEDGFQWQNDAPNGPLAVNPPQGFGVGSSPGSNYPLGSKGFGGINTEIQNAGVANSGTRVALSFIAMGETVTVPQVVYLHPLASPSTTSGVMVLTTTDSVGGGPFNPSSTTTISNAGMAVYEVLFNDEFAIEYADIPVEVSGFHLAEVTVSLAPFFTPASGAGQAAPTIAHATPNQIPRFNLASATSLMILTAPIGIGIFF